MRDKYDLSAGVLAYLQKWHTGAERSVSSAAIEYDFGIGGAAVRQAINKLRCEGQPISTPKSLRTFWGPRVCSDANSGSPRNVVSWGESGYYYAKNKGEIDSTIAQLFSRTKKINAAARGLVLSQRGFNSETEVRC